MERWHIDPQKKRLDFGGKPCSVKLYLALSLRSGRVLHRVTARWMLQYENRIQCIRRTMLPDVCFNSDDETIGHGRIISSPVVKVVL